MPCKKFLSLLFFVATSTAGMYGDKSLAEESKNQSEIANKVDDRGRSELHVVSEAGELKEVNVLIKAGANVNAIDIDGNTALYYAAREDRVDVMKQLVSSGGNLSISNLSGRTVAHIVVEQNLIEAVQFLAEQKADFTASDNQGLTPLHLVRTPEIAEIVIENGGSLDSADVKGRTPLHLAVVRGDLDLIEALIAFGASVTQKDKTGSSAIDYAQNLYQGKKRNELMAVLVND